MVIRPAYNWSGFYAGVHAGFTPSARIDNVITYRLGGRQHRQRRRRRAIPDRFAWTVTGSSAVARSATTGSSASNWVFGVETDISLRRQAATNRTIGTLSLPTAAPPNAPLNNTFRTRMEYFGTVRGRIGYRLGFARWSTQRGFVPPLRSRKRAPRSSVQPDSCSSGRPDPPYGNRLHGRWSVSSARLLAELERESGIFVLPISARTP